MNYLQLVQRLRSEVGASGTGPQSVSGQTGLPGGTGDGHAWGCHAFDHALEVIKTDVRRRLVRASDDLHARHPLLEQRLVLVDKRTPMQVEMWIASAPASTRELARNRIFS